MFHAVGTKLALFPRVKLLLVAALLTLSLVAGFAGTTREVDARPRTFCMVVTDERDWKLLTGEVPGPDWVGGMYCWKG